MRDKSRFQSLVDQVRAGVSELTVEEVRRRLDEEMPLYLFDVREKDEWDRGHLPGAVHLSKGVIERDIEKVVPNPDQEIVLYCGGGSRSALAAANLQQMGYRNVHSLRGGAAAWTNASLPLVKD